MPQVKRAGAAESPVIVNVGPQAPPAENLSEEEKPQLEPDWFFDKISAIAADEWQKTTVLELVRLSPNVPGVPGSKGFLDVFTEPVSKAQIKQRYGGGKFRLVLKRNSKYVTSHDFDIEGDPIYARGREIPPSENFGGGEVLSRLLNMMEKNTQELKEELRRREASGTSDPALEKAISMLSTAYSTGLDAMRNGGTGGLLEMVRTLKELGIVGASNNGGGVLETVRVLKELGVIGAPAAAAAVADPLAQLNTALGIFEKLDALRGETSGRPRDWKAIAAEKALDVLPGVLERMGTAQPRRGPQPVQRPQPMRPSVPANPAPAQPPMPQPMRGAAPPPATGLHVVSETESAAGGRENPPPQQETSHPEGLVETAAPAAETLPNAQPVQEAESPEYLEGVKKKIVEAVRAGDDGSLIVDFLEMAWPAAVNYLEAFSAQQITELFAKDATLAHAVSSRNWQRCLLQAQTYLHQDLSIDAPQA